MSAQSLSPEFVQGLQQAFSKVSYQDLGEITGERAVSDLGLDSVTMAELLIVLEEQLDVALEQNEIDGVKTIGDLQDVVERARAAH